MSGDREAFIASAGTINMQSAYLVICKQPGVANRTVNNFLMKLYCKNGGCTDCPDCQSVLQGHIDIMRLSAPKVAEFREAISFVAEKPASKYKAVVIENADDMTDAAANSMLKTLEEPPSNTVFILESRSAAGVLPTVASRCAAAHITPDAYSENAISRALGVDDITAHILNDLSGGFAEEAELIYNDKAFWKARPRMLDVCGKLLSQRGMEIKDHADFIEESKERLMPLLCVMQSYFRDILVYQKTKNERLIANIDKLGEINRAAQGFTSGAVSNIIKVILEAERRFFFSVNFRLAVEKMLFDILEEKNRWKKS
jgi:DNA polymerase-3 subunit delta'